MEAEGRTPGLVTLCGPGRASEARNNRLSGASSKNATATEDHVSRTLTQAIRTSHGVLMVFRKERGYG